MTEEQKAILDLAVLNLKTHGDDQLLSAVKPLIDFYAASTASEKQESIYEQIAKANDDFHRPLPMTSDKQEAVAWTSSERLEKIAKNPAHVDTMWGEALANDGTDNVPLYAAPLAQSAEQDRIDAELRFLDDDEITEAANKFRLGNPRFDTLRCFVNYVIIVAQHKGASK
jgi:hypothetical protein